MNTEKTNTKTNTNTHLGDSIESLINHRYIKVGFIIVLGIGALYLTSKVFHVVANTTDAFKKMTTSFRN